ncbi:MAG: TonB family protein [Myxococcota bacterium]|nr:TonB family protein [Myxococcota bacterium]
MLLLGAGCAVAPPPQPASLAAPEPDGPEDATPTFLGEDEVDVPAALRGPLDPIYPEAEMRSGRESDVVARVAVRADGAVAGVRITESESAAFAEAAEQAIRGADFAPARKGREPVGSLVTLRVRFRIER